MKTLNSSKKGLRGAQAVIAGWVLVLLLQCGCATDGLWQKDGFVPALSPQISLFESEQPSDVLVEYDEWISRSRRVQRRAYLLQANRQNVANYLAPDFLSPGNPQHLKPIPYLQAGTGRTHPLPATGYCALTTANSSEFVLFRDGQTLGTFKLPAYRKMGTSLAHRLLLTPAAVAVDATAVAAIGTAAGVTQGVALVILEKAVEP